MQTFQFDMARRGIAPVLNAKQGDVGRKFKAVLTDAGAAYTVPRGAQFSVWYSGPSGEGNYSAIGENSAFVVEGNTVVVELITQMLTNAGTCSMCLVMTGADGSQLGLWNMVVIVEPVPGMGSAAAEQHYTALSEVAEKAVKAAETFQTDTTMTVSGRAADAAATGAALAGKAPAGYGLGGTTSNMTTLTTKAEVDNAMAAGWYEYYGTENACGYDSTQHGGILVIPSMYTITQFFFPRFQNGSFLKRVFLSDTVVNAWQPWEWMNPPMVLGVEYRTTERWNGKAVYTKLVNCGNPGKGETNIPHDTPMTNVLRYAGTMGGQWALPNFTTDGNAGSNAMWCKADKTHIWTFMGAMIPAEDYTLYVTLWYTKD